MSRNLPLGGHRPQRILKQANAITNLDLFRVFSLWRPVVFSSSGEPSKPKKRVFVEDVDDEDDGGGSGDDDDDAQPQGHDLVPVKHWQVGETCQAVWAKDGQ